MLAEYEQPKIDEGVDEALKDFVARRKHEITKQRAASGLVTETGLACLVWMCENAIRKNSLTVG